MWISWLLNPMWASAVATLRKAGFAIEHPQEDWLTPAIRSSTCCTGSTASWWSRLLPPVRAVRERLDWGRIRSQTADNDCAVAFLVLAERLGLTR
jgi:hypothetical protein